MQTEQQLTNNRFNDEKAHYKSLIDLFKFCITIITTLITIIGLGIGFFTYSNGKEMRDGLEKEKNEMKENVNAMKADLKDQENDLKKREDLMKADLKEQEEVMRTNISNMVLATKDEIGITKDQAIKQIGNIRNVATNEARNRIDQVFRERKLDKFFEDIATKRMEPRIQKNGG